AAIAALQRMGLLRDALRGLVLTAASLAAGRVLIGLFAHAWRGGAALAPVALAASSAGVALVAGLRLSGGGRQRLWLAGGLRAGAARAGRREGFGRVPRRAGPADALLQRPSLLRRARRRRRGARRARR